MASWRTSSVSAARKKAVWGHENHSPEVRKCEVRFSLIQKNEAFQWTCMKVGTGVVPGEHVVGQWCNWIMMENWDLCMECMDAELEVQRTIKMAELPRREGEIGHVTDGR